ncbi:MAG: nucleoside recognition domain-containing protein [bacterium]|nr:nucleoside recognition protein [Candidatus Sumerlaeota bacterium]
MLNHIWVFLVVVGVLVGLSSALYRAQKGEMVTKMVDGKPVTQFVRYETFGQKADALAASGNKLTREAFNSVSFRYTDPVTGKERDGAVGIAIGFIGIMSLWLGFMKIAETSGLISLLARFISPLFRILFPSIPRDHPAAGAMLMNIAANMLGLDNAATPLGLKAMLELQTLNGRKNTSTNAMCMFLCMNVASLTILPASIIGYRVQAGSANPTAFWVPAIIATGCAQIFTIVICKIIERFSADNPPPDTAGAADGETAGEAGQ